MMLYFCLGVYCATIWIYIAFLADLAMYQLSSEAIPAFPFPYSSVQFPKLHPYSSRPVQVRLPRIPEGAYRNGNGNLCEWAQNGRRDLFQTAHGHFSGGGGKMECEGDVANLNFLLVIFCAIVR